MNTVTHYDYCNQLADLSTLSDRDKTVKKLQNRIMDCMLYVSYLLVWLVVVVLVVSHNWCRRVHRLACEDQGKTFFVYRGFP